MAAPACAAALTLSPNDTLEKPGLSVIVHQSTFHPIFRDEKNAGIQLILHDLRIATDGEIRLSPTPEQWDPVPAFVSRKRGPNQVIVKSDYAKAGLSYRIAVTAEGDGFRIEVDLDKPLPRDLAGKAGFNLDFLPVAYFGKTYLLGDKPGLFPRHPNGPMMKDNSGDPAPLASGANAIVLSPEDPLTRISITSDTAPLALYDARNRAQNGWFVVRALIPAGVTDNAIVWHVRPNVVKGWMRPPVVSFNQAGYTPSRNKVAVIEMDPRFKAPDRAELVKIGPDGKLVRALQGKIKPWGNYLRYRYATFDFSSMKTPGIYAIRFAGQTTNPFRIAPDAYARTWQPSLDTYLPVQMDHVAVREQYRVWHGAAHLDDAQQAPPNHTLYDGYEMGPNLDSPYKPGEHIPGLNVGGWFDAGDFDIRTTSHSIVIHALVMAHEMFGLNWDETTIDEAGRSVEIRKPDGINDVLQQVKHGTLQLLAQYRAFGHAIPGIIEPSLRQYTHIGDAVSQTDQRIYDSTLRLDETDGIRAGKPDDRRAYTTHTTGLNYSMAGALAAASRVLKDQDPAIASEALAAAEDLWQQEQKSSPVTFGSFNTTGGPPKIEEIVATVDLVLATNGAAPYASRLKALMPDIQQNFLEAGYMAAYAIPVMDKAYRAALGEALKAAKPRFEMLMSKNPYGVPITEDTWAGAETVTAVANAAFVLHRAFPDIMGPELTINCFDYLLGRHPANNLSMVATVGTSSKLVGYGNNRADYSFIPGGLLPGVLIVKPDYPEMTPNWPFFWYENEYVIDSTANYILTTTAAIELTKPRPATRVSLSDGH